MFGFRQMSDAARTRRAAEELEFRISKIKLEPGDILVLRSPKPLSPEVAKRLQEMFAKLSPSFKTLVLDAGMDLAVVSEADLAKLGKVAS